ncbi:MAG: flagellar hook-basal body complex protein FliE [Gammaproteobacteria bacterium]|jgi:flagellar hook-basal body complex protein FliE|nr:flagellar hook-basal body complex protein FliE [Gammaproteobacteria bacterium]
MSEIGSAQMLSQLRAMAAAAGTGQAPLPEGVDQGRFSELLMKAVDHVNESQQTVSRMREDFQLGGPVDLSEVMIASQKSSLEFQMLLQVRNKFINAYQEVMNMQI